MTVAKLPECWGHRGASADFPENTLASFERAMRDGAETIETDVHVSRDGVPIMFHDPDLFRTTGVKGMIKECNYYGMIDGLRTLKEPRQPVPTFAETMELLMKPENLHVSVNLDIKVQNDPLTLFPVLASHLAAHGPSLPPRIILGLWHPSFIAPALKYLPQCTRIHIGLSPLIARQYFWDVCSGFSMAFMGLMSPEGRAFREECRKANKKLYTWTVNDPRYMAEAVRWGVDAILTDTPNVYLAMRDMISAEMRDWKGGDSDVTTTRTISSYSRLCLWTYPFFYTPFQWGFWRLQRHFLTKFGGSFDASTDPDSLPSSTSASEQLGNGNSAFGDAKLVEVAEGEGELADGTPRETVTSLMQGVGVDEIPSAMVPGVGTLIEVSA